MTSSIWEFGVLLRRARTRLKLSVRESARRAGISESRWRQLESGAQPAEGSELTTVSTTPETVLKVSKVVGLDEREALLHAGFVPDDHLRSDEVDAVLRREMLDIYDQLSFNQRRALIDFIRSFLPVHQELSAADGPHNAEFFGPRATMVAPDGIDAAAESGCEPVRAGVDVGHA